MEDRETARMRKYGESKTTRIMMANVPHVTSGLGLRKFQADGFLLTRVYNSLVQKLYDTHHGARVYFVQWYLHEVHDGETNPTPILFSDAA